MSTLISPARNAPRIMRRQNAAIVQHWRLPKVILAITDNADENSLQFHAIQHARQTGAKVLIVQNGDLGSSPIAETSGGNRRALPSVPNAAERMASRLLLAGIRCEPLRVQNPQTDDILFIARSCSAGRVLVSGPMEAPCADQAGALADHLIDKLDVPICIVERGVPAFSRYQRPSRRVILVLSPESRNELPVAFCSRLAQENHSQLTLLRILPNDDEGHRRIMRAPAHFLSEFPSSVLRKAEQRCPLDLVVRQGDAATEILNCHSRIPPDVLVLAPCREAGPLEFGISAVRNVIRNAQCPVIVLRDRCD